MGERFTHNGVEYEDLGNGKARVVGAAPTATQAPFTAVPLPLSPQQQAEEGRKQQDQIMQDRAAQDRAASEARAAQEWQATHNSDGSPKLPQQQAPSGFRFTQDGNLQAIPGGPADTARNGRALRQGDSDNLRKAVNQFADMARIRSNFVDNYGGNIAGGVENWAQGYVSSVGTPGQRDWWSDMAAMDNVIRNGLFGASLTEGEKAAFNRTTVSPGMDPKEIEKNLGRRQDVMRGALQRYIGGLKAGGWSSGEIDALVGDQAPDLYPRQERQQQQQAPTQPRRDDSMLAGGMGTPPNGGGADGGNNPPPPPPILSSDSPLRAAPSGSTQAAAPLPQAMQDEYAQWMGQNSRNLDPARYADFRASLDEKYGFPVTLDQRSKYKEWANGARDAAAQGAVSFQLNPPTRQLSGFEQFRNDAVNNPAGAFMANLGNAGGFGMVDVLAGDKMDALRDANPVSSTLGEAAGGITGSFATGAGLSAASRAVENPIARALLSSPLAADVAYGGVYGATQGDDPLYGAVAGAGGALVGNAVGRQIGKLAPRVFGRFPADPLNRGERAVLNAANRTGTDRVAEALARSSDLGIPMSLADASTDINSLAGAAIRRSPGAAAMARDTLGARSRGQYDRFVGAVERDLGPVTNVPQRSEDLIAQARMQAGPLYDAAYAAPGASVIDLSDLMARPSMSRALTNARRIAQEEGRAPDALGIILGPDGAATVHQPSWQTLDYVKRGLDDVLEGYRDKTTGRLNLDTEGGAIDGTRRDFLKRVDSMNPDYAAARGAYAGPATEREALRSGQEALGMSPDQLGVNFNRATPAQQAQMRLGAQSHLVENAGKLRYSTNPFESVLGTPAMEQRLARMYGDEGDANIARLLLHRDTERDIAASSNRLIGNSMTAERKVADEAFAPNPLVEGALHAGAAVATHGASIPGTAARMVATGLSDRLTLGLGRRAADLADEIAPLALDTDTQGAIAKLLLMKEGSAARDRVAQALIASSATRGGHIGAGTGSSLAAALMR
jgi:hypothetical protein